MIFMGFKGYIGLKTISPQTDFENNCWNIFQAYSKIKIDFLIIKRPKR
jgi:hypothetical protein